MRILIVTLALLLTGSALAEAAVQTADVTYSEGGASLTGFAAWDDSAPGPRPGVLIVHQWMGLTDYEKQRARMLAELGYYAFACDIYGAELKPANQQEAGAAAGTFRGDADLFRRRLAAGLAQLRAQPGVDMTRIAAIGYCFGGGGVLELARSGADLAGVVSFHGALKTPAPALPGAVKARVLVCHGADDPHVPPAEVAAFQDEMRASGADWQFIAYGGAVHSFTDWNANSPGQAMYDEAADRRSWAAMLSFFSELFGSVAQPSVAVHQK